MSELSSLGIESIHSQPPTLEELFMRHYGSGASLVASSSTSGGTSHGIDAVNSDA